MPGLGEYAGRRITLKRWRTSRRFRWAIRLLLAAFVLVVIVLLSLPWLLIAPPQTPPSDVILHYAIASNTDADEYVVQLYRQGVAKKIVCINLGSECGNYTEYARQHLLELGVPAEDVLTLPLPSTDCLAANLPRFTAMAKAQGWQQSLLVLRPSVTRTDGGLAAKYFSRAGLRLAVTSAPGERQRFTFFWWTKHETAQAMIEAIVNGMLDQVYPECR